MAEAEAFPPNLEKRKRRRERLLIVLTLVLVVALTSWEVYLVRQGGQPVAGSLLAFGLLNLNALLFLLFTFLIFRHLTKLFLERRRRVFGSRLRTRLVLTFITLALLPTLFMFFIAWQLISSRVDSQWGGRVADTVGQNLALSRAFSQELEEKLTALGHLFRQELLTEQKFFRLDEPALRSLLTRWQETYQLSGLEIFTPAGRKLAEAYDRDIKSPLEPPPSVRPGDWAEETLHRQAVEGGMLVSLVEPLRSPSGRLSAYLVLREMIPQPLVTRIMEVENQVRDLRAMQFLIRPVRVSHYLALVIVTLLTLMAAIWLAFYMAREITTPIRQLAEGTLKVAGGDFDFHIDQEGKDEIGFLVQSFNKMTQDLQQSRAQLAAAYEQLRQSHAELADKKRHMEILLRNVAAGVIAVDAQGRVTAINNSAAQMLQVDPEEVLGREARVLLPPEEVSRLAEVVEEARRSQRTVERPLHLTLADRTLYLIVKPTVLKDDSGRDLGVVVVFEDLTELERAQRQAAWREVARRIAHEVKNPLTPIKLAAQRLRRRYQGLIPDDGQVFEECTRIISDQADVIKNLVNEFSHFARLPHPVLAPQDLNRLIQDTLLLYKGVHPRISLEFQPDPELPAIPLDQEQIKRLLLNLVDNALASIQDSGKISLSVRQEPNGEWVELVVADTGVGIPDKDKTRIFEPYFSTKRGGTGLGLAIAHSIVSDHHGMIRVEDNQPCGAKFIIKLPTRRGSHALNHTGSG
jgi:two-component system nitrogen regulation sensor histidine kinase NtrY|uniref:histidine kinase n=1 Tax=Desulfobacca acetoxidans TaxID=60893 RepID=A0A7C3SJV9_9BACT